MTREVKAFLLTKKRAEASQEAIVGWEDRVTYSFRYGLILEKDHVFHLLAWVPYHPTNSDINGISMALLHSFMFFYTLVLDRGSGWLFHGLSGWHGPSFWPTYFWPVSRQRPNFLAISQKNWHSQAANRGWPVGRMRARVQPYYICKSTYIRKYESKSWEEFQIGITT